MYVSPSLIVIHKRHESSSEAHLHCGSCVEWADVLYGLLFIDIFFPYLCEGLMCIG